MGFLMRLLDKAHVVFALAAAAFVAVVFYPFAVSSTEWSAGEVVFFTLAISGWAGICIFLLCYMIKRMMKLF